MATSSIFKNMEFDDEMIRRIFKAIGDSKKNKKRIINFYVIIVVKKWILKMHIRVK